MSEPFPLSGWKHLVNGDVLTPEITRDGFVEIEKRLIILEEQNGKLLRKVDMASGQDKISEF